MYICMNGRTEVVGRNRAKCVLKSRVVKIAALRLEVEVQNVESLNVEKILEMSNVFAHT
jgi:hypothetical protein